MSRTIYGRADFVELQHQKIEQLKAELEAMQRWSGKLNNLVTFWEKSYNKLNRTWLNVMNERDEALRSAAAWKASAKMHREDELAFEQTIRGYEQDLVKIRRERDEVRIEFWQRAYDRAMKFSVSMVAQRDEARQILVNIAVNAGRSWTDSQMGPPTQFRIHERYILPAIEFVKETKMESDDRLAPGKPNSSIEMIMVSPADMARLKKLETEHGLLLERIKNLTEYTWWSEWQQARKECDEARAVARRLFKRLKAIEAAVPKMAIYADFQDPIDAMQQMEHYIKTEVPKAGPIDDEPYDVEAFEEAMELKKKLP